MVHSFSRWRLLLALPAALLTATAAAQSQPVLQAARPDPLDAKASVPTLVFESSFSQYQRFSDQKLISWREANDTVTRIGGWRVYAREAQQPDPVPAQKPMQPSPPAADEPAKSMPQGHDGHKTHAPGATGAAR
jgi:hypothetical protein